MYTYLSACTNKEWTNVERSTTFIRRHKAFVQFYHLLNHLFKDFGGKFGHKNTAASALQAFGIILNAESANLSIGAAESLHTLESLLSVV